MTGTIFDIKEMAVHDGPGLRTTVFFKGCPLRCSWCHNPEGLSFAPQLLYKRARCRSCGLCRIPCTHADCRPFGRCLHICPENCLEVAGCTISAADLAQELRRSAAVLGSSFGGITFSGGEPLAQPEFLLEVMSLLPDQHLCIETSGHADSRVFAQVIREMDYVILDIKLADTLAHKRYTGVDNRQILKNFAILQNSGIPYLIRTPLIPGITDTEENLSHIRQLIGSSPWEQLPYNAAAGAKYPMLDMIYPLNNS